MTTTPPQPSPYFDPTEYVTASVWGEANGVHVRTVRRMCDRGQIPGAWRDGAGWHVPATAPVPFTTPRHMRPASRTVPGELVPTIPGTDVSPRWTSTEILPATPLHTPENPLYVTHAQLAAMVEGIIDPRTLSRMLATGEIPGALRRGKADEHGHATWIVPGHVVRRLRGDIP